MKIEKFVLGPMGTNCYIAVNEENGECFLVDPAAWPQELSSHIRTGGKKPLAVLLTHGHFDHCAGADHFVKEYQCPLYIHPLDEPMLRDPKLNFSADFAPLVVTARPRLLQRGKQTIGHFTIEVIDAPGHSEGSCLLLLKDRMFCGDVLFQGSIGRTDLIGGSNPKMVQTLRMLKQLGKDYIVYPGHGPATTLNEEIRYNYYLQSV